LRDSWSAAGIGIPDALSTETTADEITLETFVRAIRAARR
jgi:hypothetical protein